MRVLSILVICMLLALPGTLYPATTVPPVNKTINPSTSTYKKLSSLKASDVQKLIGRKLTLKEKISLLVLKHTSRNSSQSKKGKTALIIASVALGLFIIGLFVPFIILGAFVGSILAIILGSSAKRQDPSDKNAHAAVLLGWIVLGGIAVLGILAAIVISSWV